MAKDQDAPIKLPVRYDEYGGYFWDADDSMIAQVRGWGELTGRGGQNLSDDAAEAVQTKRGRYIATCINNHARYKNALESISGCVDVDYAIKRAQVALGELPASVFDGYISDTAREIWKDDKEK